MEDQTKETIFLIDDDLSVREGLTGLIESVGLPVKAFGSALEFLALKPMDVEGCVVLDINMPGMNGLELQRQMNDSGISLPVIYPDRPWRYSHDGACPEGRRRSFSNETRQRRRVDERDSADIGERSQGTLRAR
jgi:hypothetical protein